MNLQSTLLYPSHCDPLHLLMQLKGDYEYCALLESVDRVHNRQDFSFIALGAREVVRVDRGDPLTPFASIIGQGQAGGFLQMGWIGAISYEAARHFDSGISLAPDATVPDGLFFLPEILLKINHADRSVTIITHTGATVDTDRIAQVTMTSPFFPDNPVPAALPLPSLDDIAPYRQTTREQYCAAVREAQAGVAAGEVFQVVISQELRLPSGPAPLAVYRQLRRINPSPYMYYWCTPGRTIVGASPETLIRIDGRDITYRPIAGTRRRTADEEENRRMQAELLADQKERCEHQMLVDLGRNDLGRIAAVGSVRVDHPFHCEAYSHVYHIVSDLHATLAPGISSLDAVRSVFPAGTVTGAPKIRAMETIARLERSPRGIYGGAFGYIDATGNLDLAIAIRTLLFDDRGITLRIGAGIVQDSVPEQEDNECLHKARSCLAAVTLAGE